MPRDYDYDDQYREGHILWAGALAKFSIYHYSEPVTCGGVPDHSSTRDQLRKFFGLSVPGDCEG